MNVFRVPVSISRPIFLSFANAANQTSLSKKPLKHLDQNAHVATKSNPMHDLILCFQSPELKLGILGEATPSEAEVEGWHLREVYVPGVHVGIAKDVGSHRLLVERTLTLEDNAWDWHATGVELIERIERLWAFAAGLPLRSRGFGLELATIETLKGWESNAREVDHAIQVATQDVIVGSIGVQSRHWRYTPTFALPRLVTAMAGYRTVDEFVRERIGLHYAAHMSSSRHDQAFLFAKALEIIRELLPGKDDKGREVALPSDVRDALSRPLAWLYKLSNNRRDTRHAVTKGPSLALHPQMPGEEYFAFVSNADLVIRFVVCSRLGLDVIIIKDSSARST